MDALRTQFPLSSRKFWKKLLEKSSRGVATLFTFELLAIAGTAFLDPVPGSSPALFWSAALFGFVLWIGVVLLYAWYVQIYIKTYFYDADEHFITIRKGVFSPQEVHVAYEKIQDIFVSQDVFDRVLGLYDVHIASAGYLSGALGHIDGVNSAAAEGLKEYFLSRVWKTAPETIIEPTQTLSSMEHSVDIVSSTTYPISGKWIVYQAILGAGKALGSAAFFLLIFFGLTYESNSSMDMAWLPHDLASYLVTGLMLSVVLYVWHVTYWTLWKASFSFDFLPEYVRVMRGVINRQETHLLYRTVQDVRVSQSILERLLGICTVSVDNATGPFVAGGAALPGQSYEKGTELSTILRSRTIKKNSQNSGL